MNDKKTDSKEPVKKEEKKEKTMKLSEDARMKLMLVNKMKEMETEFDVTDHVVIDLGNAITKIGFSGEDLPAFTIPSIYGKNKILDSDKKDEMSTYEQKFLYGYESLSISNKDNYNITYLTPGDHKTPTSPEYLDFLKEVLENKMGLSISDYNVIVNMSPIKNTENINTYGKFLLEDLGFRAMAVINSSSLSLFSTGRTSGMVVECGEVRTYTVPIYEGFPLYHALNKTNLGARDLTNIIRDGVVEAKLGVDPNDIFTLRSIKEKTCSIPYKKTLEDYLNSEEDIISKDQFLYKLPDETIIPIPKKCRLLASELLFNPSVVEMTKNKELGLKDLITSSIKKCSVINYEFNKLMMNNIVLSGGTTMIPGFSNRIIFDIVNSNDHELNLSEPPRVISQNYRYISKWVGMSMIASMTAFDRLFIKKDEFLETGTLSKIF